MELIYPGTDKKFALKKGQGVKLKMPSGNEEHFGMGQLYAEHSYTYVGIDGEKRCSAPFDFGPKSVKNFREKLAASRI